jgi:hypothetical protein
MDTIIQNLNEDKKFNDNFEFKEVIGRGAFGTVLRAMDLKT